MALTNEVLVRGECRWNRVADKPAILHFIASAKIGGAQRHVQMLARDIASGGFRPVVACPRGPLLERLREDGVESHSVKFGVWSAFRIARMIRRTGARILHLHLFGAAVAGVFGSLLLVRRPSIIYTAHNMLKYPGMGSFKRSVFQGIMRVISPGIDRIVAVSEQIRDCLVSSGGVSYAKVTVIPNGVSFTAMEERMVPGVDCRQLAGVPAGAPVLGSIGRFEYEKGYDLLVQAMSTLAGDFPKLHCVMVGDGRDRAHLARKVKETGLEARVHLVGFQEDVLSWLRSMDIVAFPSRTEGMPLAVIEAAYAGRPIVATNVGGTRNILRDGVTGVLVPPEDSQALVAGVRKLLRQPVLAGDMAGKAREYVLERFDMQRCSEVTLQLYRELLAGEGTMG